MDSPDSERNHDTHADNDDEGTLIDDVSAAHTSIGAESSSFRVETHDHVPGITAVDESLDVSAALAALDIDRDYERSILEAVDGIDSALAHAETATTGADDTISLGSSKAPSQSQVQTHLLGASLSKTSLVKPVTSARVLSRPASAIDYEIEGSAHDSFLAAVVADVPNSVGLESNLLALDEAVASPCPVAVTGEKGTGKTRLLAEFVDRRKAAPNATDILFYHFVGCNGRSGSPTSLLGRLSKCLAAALGMSARFDPPSEHDRLRDKAAELLMRANDRGMHVTCVVDGLDRLEGRPPFGSWLPAGALSSCRFVFSVAPGSWKDVVERLGFKAKLREIFLSQMSDRDAGTLALVISKAVSDSTLTSAQLNALASRLRVPRRLSLAVRLALPAKGADGSLRGAVAVDAAVAMEESALFAALVGRSAAEHRQGLDSSVGAGEDPFTDALVMIALSRNGLLPDEVRASLQLDRTVWGGVLSTLLADGFALTSASGHLIARHRSLVLAMAGIPQVDVTPAHLLAASHTDALDREHKSLSERATGPCRRLATYFGALVGGSSDRDCRRAADELPWLLLRLGRTDELKAALSPRIAFERMLATDRHTLRAMWKVVGTGGPEIASLYTRTLGREGGAGPDLYGRAAILIGDLGHPASGVGLAELSLKLVEDSVGRKHPAYADACNRLGQLQWMVGRLDEAVRWHRTALDVIDGPADMRDRSKSVSSITSTTANARNPRAALFSTLRLLGAAEAALGRYEDALHATERALDVQEHLLGLDHVEVASTCESIGHLHSHLDHNEDAIVFYERCLGIRESVLGVAHPSVVVACRSIANARMRNHQFALAVPILERCLDLLRQRLGPSHREVAIALVHLGVAIARASTVADQGEANSRKKTKSGTVARVASSIVILGRRLSVVIAGDKDATIRKTVNGTPSETPVDIAFNFLKAALKTFEALEDMAGISAACDNLAVLSGRVRDYDGAVEYHRRALKCRQTMYGEDHAEVATSLNDIGACLVMAGRPGEAIQTHLRALDIRERAFGSAHPATATALANLAVAQEVAGRLEEAVGTLRRALAAAEAARDAGADKFAASKEPGSASSALQRVTDESLALAVADACSALGVLLVRTSPKGVRSSSPIAEEALGLLRRALDIREKALGAIELKGNAFASDYIVDDSVIKACTNLGRAYVAFGEHALAADFFAQCCRALERAAGHGSSAAARKEAEAAGRPDRDSVALASALSVLASAQYQIRDYDNSRMNFDRALEMRKRLFGERHKETVALRKYIAGKKFPAGGK